jgi:aspartate dehydrogenase
LASAPPQHAPRSTRVAFIGNGSVVSTVLDLLTQQAPQGVVVAAVLHRSGPDHGGDGSVPYVSSFEDLLATSPDVVAEAAGHDAMRQYAVRTIASGLDLVPLSMGALADRVFESTVQLALGHPGAGRMVIPSGAIGALDAIAAASAAGYLEKVTHTILKPAEALAAQNGAKIEQRLTLFDGTVREGALRFPASTNSAVAVALAGIGLDRTRLQLIAVPRLRRNRHVIRAAGAFGELRFRIDGRPSARRPTTSALTAMSLYEALLRYSRTRRAW